MIDTTTLPETRPAEPTTPIRPSEAIRLGCLIAPVQAFGGLGKREVGGVQTACVLMAIDLASNGSLATFQMFAVAQMVCPECEQANSGGRVMVHLNDDHRWSRERIADWLEGLGL
jgi:hypothetical protein